MTKMISTIPHRYAGVDLDKFETFDVEDERYVETLIRLGRAEVFEDEPAPIEPEPESKQKKKRSRKLHRVH